MILSCQNISKAFVENQVLKNVSFHIEDHEKAAIVGINGAGKTTLLRIIVGEMTPDDGQVVLAKDKTLGYLAQNSTVDTSHTIYEELLSVKADLLRLEEKIRECENDMKHADGDALEDLMKQYTSLTHAFETGGGYLYRSELVGVLKGLGFTEDEFSKPVATLSGGQKTRVALGRLLLQNPDLIILDEPTNHLDMTSIAWLETYLLNYKGAVLIVSHDRYFLDSVTDRILELDKGKIYSYDANYSGYLELKMQREEMAQASEKKRLNILRNELAWVQRGARARSTKQKARLQRFEELKNVKGPVTDGKVELASAASRLGRTTVEIENVSKSYGDKVLIRDFTYLFGKDDRVGFIGPNGSGKTTLMKMILGEVAPDSGHIEIGQTVKLGYYAQEIDDTMMHPEQRVIDYIRDVAEYIITEDGQITAARMLERFLFSGEDQYGQLGKLSGGERRRLQLCKVLMGAPNVLILDEPTNDLDIATLQVLEDYLDTFPGIVIVVSHDRYFLDRVVRRIFALEDTRMVQYEGGYTDYANRKAAEGNTESTGTAAASQPKNADEETTSKNWKNGQKRKLKFTYQEQKDYESIEGEMAALEDKIATLEADFSKYASDFVKLNELTQEKEAAEQQLEEKMERWMYLEDLAARIERGEEN